MVPAQQPQTARFAVLDFAVPTAMAHRGGNLAAENTLAAFTSAVELGYLLLETDVHLTADGHLVAFHDDDLGRVGGVDMQIATATLKELQSVDLGGGHRLPLMADLFAAFPTARFTIDPKSDAAVDPLIAVIEETDAIDRVCIGSFSNERTAKMRAALGQRLCTSPSPFGMVKVLAAAYLGLRWTPPFGCVQIPIKAYGVRLDRASMIDRLHRMGLQVHYWTVNDQRTMKRLLDLGADVLITDETELARQLLIERGTWSAAPPPIA